MGREEERAEGRTGREEGGGEGRGERGREETESREGREEERAGRRRTGEGQGERREEGTQARGLCAAAHGNPQDPWPQAQAATGLQGGSGWKETTLDSCTHTLGRASPLSPGPHRLVLSSNGPVSPPVPATLQQTCVKHIG